MRSRDQLSANDSPPAGVALQKLQLGLLGQDGLGLDAGLGQRQPRHLQVPPQRRDLGLVRGEDLDHSPLEVIVMRHQAVSVQRIRVAEQGHGEPFLVPAPGWDLDNNRCTRPLHSRLKVM